MSDSEVQGVGVNLVVDGIMGICWDNGEESKKSSWGLVFLGVI